MKKYNRRKFIKTASFGALGAAAFAAGCGQTGGNGGGVEQALPTDVKVGVLLPYSKVFAILGDHITKGMELYLDSVDYTAGGRSIFLIKEDTENEAQAAMRKARRLIEQQEVNIMTGIVNTGIAYALRDTFHNNKVPMIVSNAGGDALTRAEKSPYIFRSSFSNWQPGFAMGQWVAENVSKNALVTAADYGAGHESVAGFIESFKAAGGNIIDEVWAPLGTNDYGSYLAQIRRANPEVVYCFYAGSDAARFVNQFEEYGLKDNIQLTGAGFLVEDDVLGSQGDSAVGIYSSLHWANALDTPENIKFMQDYRETYGEEASVYAMQGYDTARVIVEALNTVDGDTSDPDGLSAAISKVSFTSPRGPFAFDPDTNNVVHHQYIREVQKVDGALKNVVIDVRENLRDPGK